MPPAEPPAARAVPASLLEVFLTFTALALQGFGGVLAVAQRELVDRKGWLTREEFLDAYSVAQLLPGPNVVNLSLMLGDRFFGLPGALAAIAGMLAAPLAIVLALAAGHAHLAAHPQVAGALRGMGAVAAGLMVAMAFKLIGGLRRNPMGAPACALFVLATLVAVAVLRLPLAWVIFGLGGLGWCTARWYLWREAQP
ncbi:chromate transporter [Pseudothauera rhizosphaerae]|uniref:Chromate transporter n=1 Tax=Pseudothauera rhizosphaerae TaxID=2565932 RepID=A0A4S4AMV0_9RHOO|nr:chromate transporter [Pseudothauera rhizosphaerae]THF60953.1 chromate transporter [Pseudothauera rhizosphaerae]